MKIKNQIIKMLLLFTATFTIFSCTDNETNKEIPKLPTIVEIASADAQFSVLVKALTVAKLAGTFSGQGSYTVFAPTNNAFAAYRSTNFPNGIKDETLFNVAVNPQIPLTLPKEQSDELTKLLQNHVLGVGTRADDLLTAGYSKTFASGIGSNNTLSMFVNKVGSDVLINGGVSNDGAKVINANIDASNGVIHVVDNVIKLPLLLNHVIANPDLSTLVKIVSSENGGTYGEQTAVKDALSKATPASPLTVFAPTNTAFKAVIEGDGFLTGAAATAVNITKTLQYHVTKGNLVSDSTTSWTRSSATDNVTITTLLEVTPEPAQKFTILKSSLNIKETSTTVTASKITLVNIQCTNGSIHVIDRVLKPVL
jgi:uncharacterized surface protein with fasciclin (FAS1) repeats